jgi:hypothetical protein
VRLARIDYAVATIEIVDKDAPVLPTPGHAPARLTAEGYLLADALLARDGLLEYSDGKETWYEYRPRAELEAAAASWCLQPVTDKHPARMVDASTWSKVARGVCASVPTIVDLDGVAYMHAKLLITDGALIDRVQKQHDKGEPVQLSIGFTSVVIERAGEYAGTPFRFVQTEIVGNHEAIVDEGRAGPICRVLLDGKNAPADAYEITDAPPDRESCYTHEAMAEKPLTPNAKPAPAKPATDEAGSPDEMVEVPGPDGKPTQLPSWAAAAVAKLRALEGGQPPAPAPAAPPATMAPAPAPAPMANAMTATPPAPAAPAAPSEEDRKESLSEMIRSRRKLERLAERVGVEAAKLDDADDDLRRAVIAKRMPHVKCDKLDGAALVAFVDAIASEPAEAHKPAKAPSPWRLDDKPTGDKPAAKNDSTNKALAEYLASQGYGE